MATLQALIVTSANFFGERKPTTSCVGVRDSGEIMNVEAPLYNASSQRNAVAFASSIEDHRFDIARGDADTNGPVSVAKPKERTTPITLRTTAYHMQQDIARQKLPTVTQRKPNRSMQYNVVRSG